MSHSPEETRPTLLKSLFPVESHRMGLSLLGMSYDKYKTPRRKTCSVYTPLLAQLGSSEPIYQRGRKPSEIQVPRHQPGTSLVRGPFKGEQSDLQCQLFSTHVVVAKIKKTEHFKKEGVINNVNVAGV